MAIKMLREPSETPNINNIDDIVGLRYAYSNQNGFVKGKGTEISSTTELAAIRINSGRIVLQGVECDIDAAGVRLAIDNIATQRYYVVYLEVNLALNKAELKTSFGTLSYPTIEAGDDLTTSTNGVARLPIYKFEAINGVISSVVKVIIPIQYTKDIKVKNAITADNAAEATHAAKATKADEATYADSDHSKGTIEERLKLYQHNIFVEFKYRREYKCLRFIKIDRKSTAYNLSLDEFVQQINDYIKYFISGFSQSSSNVTWNQWILSIRPASSSSDMYDFKAVALGIRNPSGSTYELVDGMHISNTISQPKNNVDSFVMTDQVSEIK